MRFPTRFTRKRNLVFFALFIILLVINLVLGLKLFKTSARISIVNTSQHFKLNAGDSSLKGFDQDLANLKVWANIRSYDQKKKIAYDITKIRIVATDNKESANAYVVYTDQTKKKIRVSAKLVKSENNTADVNLYINPEYSKSLDTKALNFAVMSVIFKAIYLNSGTTDFDQLEKYLKKYYDHSEANPFSVTFLNSK